jgi:anti-sigma factor RsiW
MNGDEITDEQLTAYADGELDAAAAQRIDAASAADPALAARIEALRRARSLVAAAFGPAAGAPVPEALRAAVAAAAARAAQREPEASPEAARAAAPAELGNVARRQGAANASRYALAASVAALAVGVLAFLAGQQSARVDGMQLAAGALRVAADDDQRAIDQALGRLPGGTRVPLSEGQLAIAASYRLADGTLCRAFSVEQPEAGIEALACRERHRWTVMLASRAQADGGYAPASSAGPVESFLEQLGAGAALDPADEAKALAEAAAK